MNALVEAAAQFGDVDSSVGGVTAVDVAVGDWSAALESVREAGGSYLDALAAADFESDGLQIVAHVMTDTGADAVLVRTLVPGDAAELASVGQLWAGATWHEREITDLFGITFIGSSDDRPLLMDRDGAPPLLKSTPLAQRYESEWPGGFDPADKPGARRRLPLGVEETP